MGKYKKVSKDERLFVAKEMPPLYRTKPGQEYSYKADEVFAWISKRPGLINYIFDKLAASKCIYFNPDTGKWQGVDYGDD